MKRPSFQFYPADWQANSNLRRCSFEEKGVWLEVICLLHDQEIYGMIKWPLKDVAQAIGATVSKLKSLADKGVLKGADAGLMVPALVYQPRSGRKLGAPVVLIPEQVGPLWYSSRMVEDEYKRVLRGETGGAPKVAPDPSPKPPLGEGIGEGIDVHPTTHLSPAQAPRAAPSSSSSSSSSKVKTTPPAAAVTFDPISDLKARGVSDQTAADWLKLRKTLKAPVTATALRDIVAEAEKANIPLERALTISCRRGWRGFEASWLKPDDLACPSPAMVPGKDYE